MATPLGTSFSSDEKIVSQTDTKTPGSFAEMLVIKFDQAKFEESTSKNSSMAAVRRYRRIRRSVSTRAKMTPACEETTFAEGSFGLAGRQTNSAKSGEQVTPALSESQDVITFDFGLESTTPLRIRFKASRYASSTEAKNGVTPSSKFLQRNSIITDDFARSKSSQRRFERRSRSKAKISEVDINCDLRDFITLKRACQCQYCVTLRDVISAVQENCMYKIQSVFNRLSQVPDSSENRTKRRRRAHRGKAQMFTVNMTSVTSRDDEESADISFDHRYSPGIESILPEAEGVYQNSRMRRK